MPLINLYAPPKNEADWHAWSFSNADSHVRIIQAIFVKYGQTLTGLSIDPIPWHNIADWLRNHQQMHNEMDSALGIDGNDLTIPDFHDRLSMEVFIFSHADEHRSAENMLGLG